MRIGILTLMHGYNYGGVLQCYSLSRALSQLGHDVEIVDYHPNSGWRRVRSLGCLLGPNGDQRVVDAVSSLKYGRDIHQKFQQFRRDFLKLSPTCNSQQDLSRNMHRYDAMVVGSDQVWNLDWFIPEYFFSFSDEYKGCLLSYAACFGHGNQPVEMLKKAGAWLERFNYISVRNTMSQKLVFNACGRESEITADPTLLVQLNELSSMPKVPHDKYILLYGLSRSRYEKTVAHLKRIAESIGLPIVAIQSDVLQKWDMSDMDYCISNPTVPEWIALFEKASFVFTDSFHGTLFALKNRVPFLNYIGSESSSDRVAYVVERYGLAAGYQDPESYNSESSLDFNAIHERIDAHVAQSSSFLKKIETQP